MIPDFQKQLIHFPTRAAEQALLTQGARLGGEAWGDHTGGLTGWTAQLYEWLGAFDWLGWAVLSLTGNFIIFGGSVLFCEWMGRAWRNRPLFAQRQAITRGDVWVAILAVVLNSGVGVLGWILWKAGWIRIIHAGWGRTLFDTVLFLGLMDFGMYLMHRVAHHRWIYGWLHARHHTHESVNSISLFVLSPLEVAGFGGLLIAVMMLIPLSGGAVFLYLGLNILFGTLGHAGVEPFPDSWRHLPVLREIGSSLFHANHHADPERNFGFYTAIWDRIFGTG